MPLSLASKGVLAGDHQQLPPLLKNCHLPSLKESIFEKIISHNARYLLYSDLSSLLAQQYRMNKLICLPSSIYFYSSRLHPGTANDSWTAADIAIDPNKSSVINLSCPLIWIDHNDQENRREMGSISNLIEINIIVRLVVDLVRDCGVDPSKITIITSFNKQKYLLSTAKKGLERFGEFKDISISTIDGYQGQENDIVIFSAVRSNQEGEIGFLKDERRINVSITRAKRMFIMVGCSKSLTKKPHGFLSIIYHVTERYGDVIHFEQKKPGEEAIFTFMNRTKKKKVPTEWKELMKNFVKDRIAKNFLVEVTSKKSKSISISADKTGRSIARQKRFNSIRAYYPLNRSKLKSQTQASPIENENQLENSLSKKPSSSFDWSLWLPRDEQQECKIIQNPAMVVRQFQRIKIQKQKASSNHPNKENQKRAQSEDVYKMD